MGTQHTGRNKETPMGMNVICPKNLLLKVPLIHTKGDIISYMNLHEKLN